MMRAITIVGLLGCGHGDAPAQRHIREDAARPLSVEPHDPIDATPFVVQAVEPGEPPASMVVVTSEPRFYVDRVEVTAGAYRECVEANACSPLRIDEWKGWDGKRAMTNVSPEQAWDYCAYRGKRLPTSKEWLRAALGTDGRKYPWGNATPSCNVAVLVHCSGGNVSNVGTKPAGASPYGALDMAGNVNEYVNDDTSGRRDRIAAAVSGGDFTTAPNDLASVFDERSGYAVAGQTTGFRCARTPKS